MTSTADLRSAQSPEAPALGTPGLLGQRLVSCPQCGLLSAVHLDECSWRVVRFVCPSSCPIDAATVELMLRPGPA